MSDSARLPGSHYWPGLPTPFWQWFRQVDAAIGSGATATVDLAALTARVAALEADTGSAGSLTGARSVQLTGNLADGATVQLRGDEDAPGATFYYGTNSAGTKGWYTHAVSTLADVDLTGLADGDLLQWVAADSQFQPVPASIAGAVPTLIASGDTYTVAADTQILWADDIDIEGTLDVSGSFIEVN